MNRPRPRHQVSAERHQPEHGRVDDHPLRTAVADRAEDGRVAAVADHHDHHEDEPDDACQERQDPHRTIDDRRAGDRLDVEEDEGHQREHAVEVALVERNQTRADGSEAGQEVDPEDPEVTVDPIEQVSAEDVERADGEQRHVEQERGLGDHTEIADGTAGDVVAGGHRGREHDDRHELSGEDKEQNAWSTRADAMCVVPHQDGRGCCSHCPPPTRLRDAPEPTRHRHGHVAGCDGARVAGW